MSRLPPSKWLWPKSPPVVPHRPSTGDRLKPTFGAKNAAAAFNSTFQQWSLLREGFLLICYQPRGSRILLFDCLLRYWTYLIYFPKWFFKTYICSCMIIAISLHRQLFPYIPPPLKFSHCDKIKKKLSLSNVGVSHFPLLTGIVLSPPWLPISPVEETLWCGAGPCSSESLGLICEGILPHKAPLVLSTMLSLKLSNTRRCRILCSTFHHRPLIIPWPQIPRRWWGRSRK